LKSKFAKCLMQVTVDFFTSGNFVGGSLLGVSRVGKEIEDEIDFGSIGPKFRDQ
jgi:hypothetical protein